MKITLEDLIAAGLTEEQAKGVLAGHKEAIDGNYVPKATFEAERTKAKDLGTQVSERDTQIKELGKFKGTAEELATKVTTLETENATAKAKFDADMQKFQLEAAIKHDLTGKVIDADDVLPRLDSSKINFKDGKIVSGLTEQLDELKKTKPHYFVADEGKDKQGMPSGWLFGKTPSDGADIGAKTADQTSAEFGKSLAQSRADSSAAAVKAADHYFK